LESGDGRITLFCKKIKTGYLVLLLSRAKRRMQTVRVVSMQLGLNVCVHSQTGDGDKNKLTVEPTICYVFQTSNCF
jgi:hypothetical protein